MARRASSSDQAANDSDLPKIEGKMMSPKP
jgi:hypothetical protein